MEIRVKFKEWNCITQGAYYSNGNKAIKLVDAEDGDLITTATVNMVEEKIDNDTVFIKDYAENSGMTETLINADIIKASIINSVKTGYVTVESFKLTKKALNHLWIDKP